MTPLVLAHLIIGDGSYSNSEGCVFIYTNSYTYSDCVKLAEAITAIGIVTTVRKERVGKNGCMQYKLAILKSQVVKLREMISIHMHPSMMYRIGIPLVNKIIVKGTR
jgi:hypothetical protein